MPGKCTVPNTALRQSLRSIWRHPSPAGAHIPFFKACSYATSEIAFREDLFWSEGGVGRKESQRKFSIVWAYSLIAYCAWLASPAIISNYMQSKVTVLPFHAQIVSIGQRHSAVVPSPKQKKVNDTNSCFGGCFLSFFFSTSGSLVFLLCMSCWSIRLCFYCFYLKAHLRGTAQCLWGLLCSSL